MKLFDKIRYNYTEIIKVKLICKLLKLITILNFILLYFYTFIDILSTYLDENTSISIKRNKRTFK